MLDPSVAAVLRTRYTVRIFFLVFGALFAATAALSLFIGINQGTSQILGLLGSFCGQLSATFASVMAIYGVWIFSTPSHLRNSHIAPLRPNEIAEFLAYASDDPASYIFFGRSGKAFRSQVLPIIDRSSKEKRTVKSVKIVVPDPESGNNSRSYATMMRGLSEKADDNTLTISVVSMALDLAIRSRGNTDLKVEMGLCATLPVLRMDLSEKGGVLTRDAQSLPGLYCGPGGYLDLFRSMAENEYRQSRKITWEADVDYDSISTAKQLNAAFQGLPPVSDEMMPLILQSLRKPKSRYER